MTNSLSNLISRSQFDVNAHARIPYQAMTFCGLICSIKRIVEKFQERAVHASLPRSNEAIVVFQREYSTIQIFKEISYLGSCGLVILNSTDVQSYVPGLSFGSSILNVVSSSLDLIANIRARLASKSLLPNNFGASRAVVLKELEKGLDLKIAIVALRVISASFQLVYSLSGVVAFGALGGASYLFSIALQCYLSNLNKKNHSLLSRNLFIRELVVG